MSKRRSPGEGSIYQRKNGLWVGQYVAQGKRHYIYGKTRKNVAQRLAKAVTDLEQGMVFDAENMTLDAYLDRWLDAIKDTVRLGTWKQYEMITRVHIRPTLGRFKLSKVNALQVQALYRQKLDAGVSPRRVRYIHVTLHKALKQAVRWQLIPRNVAASAVPPRMTKVDIRPLNMEQVKALLRAAQTQPKLYALYVLAVTTGMRQGELLGLKWEDVDLTTRTVQVRRSVFNGQINAPKTSSGKRTIKLSQTALRALRSHLERGQGVWVFPTRNGTPVGSWNFIHKSWYPLKEAAGLPKGTRFHDLRHTAATLLVQKNVNPKVISAMLGHANISITLNTYSHLLPGWGNAAAEAMDNTLGD